MATHKGPASSRPRCTWSGSSVAAMPIYYLQLLNFCNMLGIWNKSFSGDWSIVQCLTTYEIMNCCEVVLFYVDMRRCTCACNDMQLPAIICVLYFCSYVLMSVALSDVIIRSVRFTVCRKMSKTNTFLCFARRCRGEWVYNSTHS
jgi:hypothetical protein